MAHVLTQRVEKLKTAVSVLNSLLREPEPGLFSWLQAVCAAEREVHAVMEGQRDGVAPGTLAATATCEDCKEARTLTYCPCCGWDVCETCYRRHFRTLAGPLEVAE